MLERLVQKIFIAIVKQDNGYEVATLSVKKKKTLFKERHRFEGDTPSAAMKRQVHEMAGLSPIFYISTLNMQSNQGAYEGCSIPMDANGVERIGVKTLCRDKQWTQYSGVDELNKLNYEYESFGLDFIFSPFSIIEHFFADKIKEGFALYALAAEGTLTLAIIDQGKVEYAQHTVLAQNNAKSDAVKELDLPMGEAEEEIDVGGIRLDDIEMLEDLDIIDELDSLADIEDLNELEEITEFTEDQPTMEEKRMEYQQKGFSLKGALDGSHEDFQRFHVIQGVLDRFYNSDYCKNRFVETVFIADTKGESLDLKRFLEEELFLNVLVRHVDLCDEINALALLEEEGL